MPALGYFDTSCKHNCQDCWVFIYSWAVIQVWGCINISSHFIWLKKKKKITTYRVEDMQYCFQ